MHQKFLKTFSVAIIGFTLYSSASFCVPKPPHCQCVDAEKQCKLDCSLAKSVNEQMACGWGCYLGKNQCLESVQQNKGCPKANDCKNFITSCNASCKKEHEFDATAVKACENGCDDFAGFCENLSK